MSSRGAFRRGFRNAWNNEPVLMATGVVCVAVGVGGATIPYYRRWVWGAPVRACTAVVA
jgi:hypothetical protein